MAVVYKNVLGDGSHFGKNCTNVIKLLNGFFMFREGSHLAQPGLCSLPTLESIAGTVSEVL